MTRSSQRSVPPRDGALAAMGSGILLGIAALHVAWAHGGSWPARDRETLARTVLGVEAAGATSAGDGSHAGGVPGLVACYAVAAALTGAASLVAGRPTLPVAIRRLGLRGVVAALGTRGLLGLAGRTRLAVPVATSPSFVRWDRRAYAPLCLLLAAIAARSLRRAG